MNYMKYKKGGVLTTILGILITIVVIFTILGAFFLVFVIGIFHSPINWKDFGFGSTLAEYGSEKILTAHVISPAFQYKRYMHPPGAGPEKMALQVFSNDDKKQQIIILRLPAFLNVAPSDVKLDIALPKQTYFRSIQEVYSEWYRGMKLTVVEEGKVIKEESTTRPFKKPLELYFKVLYYIPFFYRFHVPPENQSLILRGLHKTDEVSFKSENINAWIWYGYFEKLAFDKKKDSWRKFYTTLLDFLYPKTGAVALLQDKEDDQTLFILTVAPYGSIIDKQEFEDFIKTIKIRKGSYEIKDGAYSYHEPNP